ncbi:MAG: hypothetical protein BWK73_42615 [Thiothrix lacustris]|uniref:Uncharacterized protein n=1 Tax=Thiothrix lacustris TaxID=525917 RepID=A0A1Y1QC97_9GAMM|nr:MAG: hypothetical protein BWK73_42615 [Thiothrix lacustris]
MAVSVKLSSKNVTSAQQQAQVFQRTLGGQVNTNLLVQKQFTALRLKTRGYRFDREDTNARF